MSKIDELIKQYCPNGVEYKRIDELCIVKTGGDTPKNCIKGQLYPSEEYPYPVYSNGTETYGYADSYRIDRDAVSISSIGNVGYVAYRAAYFTPIIRLKVLLPNTDILTTKFLFYALTAITFVGTNSSLSSMKADDVKKYKIPVPPLPVQEEVVRILDAFSSLEAELEAELEARKKQYEYYRNKLLTFNENTTGGGIEWKMLSEVFNIQRGIRVTKNQLNDNGSYPVYQNSLTPLGFYTNANCQADTTFLIAAGAAGEIGYSSVAFWAADDCFYLTDSKDVNSRYIYHVLLNQQPYIKSRVRKASIPRLSRSSIEKIVIPVPPLEEQERIVAILDKFDSLVNDISEGLPAELTARRQQYEYYRNKLLTFDEAA